MVAVAAVIYRRTHSPNRLAWPEVWRPALSLYTSHEPDDYGHVDSTYLGTKWHVDPYRSLDIIDRGRKLDVCPFWGAGSQSNTNYTMLPGPRPTSVPSGILIHPGVWPQRTWVQNCGCAPLGLPGPHLTQCGQGRGLNPCNRLATIHQRYRQTDRRWTETTVRIR